MSDRLTGKASYFLFNNFVIPITKISPKLVRKLADTTDSGDYVQQADMIGPTQIPVSVKTECAVEGRYRFSSTPSAIVAALYTSVTQIPIIVGLNQGTVWGHGLADISDFTTDIPVEDTVTFTCSVVSYGLWTPNS